MDIDLDLDELWPAATSLVGLQFATDADFERSLAILRDHWGTFRLQRPEDRYLIVRRTDAHWFADAGISYTEFEVINLDDLPPQERYERQREMIEEQMPAFLERLRAQQ